jgi:Ca-activated chloride channel homolog
LSRSNDKKEIAMKIRAARWALLMLAIICSTPLLFGDGMIVIHTPIAASSRHYVFAPLEVKYHHVTVKITDQIAVTEIDQSFYNPQPVRLEGTYMFPLPKGIEIDKFTMDIDGKPVTAELLDAEKARKIYEDIVRKMKDPALLEYAGQSMLKLRIFPIEPRSEKRIQLRYTQLLRSESGLVAYTYPLNTEKFSSSPLRSLSIKVDIQNKFDFKTIYSPSHDIEVKRSGYNRALIGYEAANVKPDTDFQLFFSVRNKDDIGCDLLTYNDGTDPDGGYFLMLMAPQNQAAANAIIEKDVVFVLDTSGSMAENHKLEQARKALLFCLQNLNARDRFNIVRFSTEAESLFGGMEKVGLASRSKAEEYIKSLKPIGGTAIHEALMKALEEAKSGREANRPCFIVFLTDGKPTIGLTNDNGIVADASKSAKGSVTRIFCLGIGTDVNAHLLDRLAETTRAASQYVLPEEDLEIKISGFYAKINEPVLANPKLRFSGSVRTSKLHPSELPDVFKGEQIVVMGRYQGTGDEAIIVEGAINGKMRTFTYEKSFPAKATDNDFVPRLWAARRVGLLLDQIRLNGESRELRDEATTLARRYGIITPYTAYLIVEDEARRNVPITSRNLQLLDRDAITRSEATRMYSDARNNKSGADAVGTANAMRVLNNAVNEQSVVIANDFAKQGQVGANAIGGARVQQSIQSQQTRNIAGRTFYQNNDVWVDSNVQQQKQRPVQVRFNSEDYFALMRRNANVPQWLSVGRNVQVVVDNVTYEIVD